MRLVTWRKRLRALRSWSWCWMLGRWWRHQSPLALWRRGVAAAEAQAAATAELARREGDLARALGYRPPLGTVKQQLAALDPDWGVRHGIVNGARGGKE